MENVLDNTILEEQNVQIVYGGFWPRLWALLLDGLIFLPLTLGNVFNILNWKSSVLMVIFSIIPIIYKPFWEYKYGTTIGKKALKMRVCNLRYEKPNLQEVLLRNIFYVGFSLLNLILYLVVFTMPDFADITGFQEYGTINELLPALTWISYLSSLVYLIEFIMLVIDDKKRSLHDRIAQTYVIKTFS